MTKFIVFYAKKMPRSFEAPSVVNPSDYNEVGTVEAEDVDDLFGEMNIGVSPRKLRVRSMSVGDIAVDEAGVATYCCSVGWTPVVWAEAQVG